MIVRDAGLILASGAKQLTSGYAHAVWGLISSYILLDRLYATFAPEAAAPSQPIPRTHCENLKSTFGGTVEKVSVSVLILAILPHLNVSSSLTSCDPQI